MKLFSYLNLRRKTANKERLKKYIKIISKETGKSRYFIEIDFLFNFIKYGCGYTDYFRCEYYNLTKEQKKTYVTVKSFYKLIKYFNKEEFKHFLRNKADFNEMFKEFLHREYIIINENSFDSFQKFIANKNVIFAKVVDGFGGHGITKVYLDEYQDKKELFDKLITNKQYLCEEEIVQSEELNKINPNSVSSFRVVTLYKNNKAYVIGNALRVNQGDNSVVGCSDDVYFSLGEDGRINSNVIDDLGNVYERHPLTNVSFKDVQIDGVKEAFEMCKKAACKLPEIRYIGWDIAFSKNGPVIIEGNEYPGYGILQFNKLRNKKTGHLLEILNICPDENLERVIK